jgi:hypothetical protein
LGANCGCLEVDNPQLLLMKRTSHPLSSATLLLVLAVATLSLLGKDKHNAAVSEPVIYTGISDASGAVPVGTNYFAVADDEDNCLRIYRRDEGGPPLRILNLARDLGVDPKHPELDLEAAARIDDVAFWMSSHGANYLGHLRFSRHTVFATTITTTRDGGDLTLLGRPYHHLLENMLSAPTLRRFNLAAASLKPPKTAGAFNVEGLSATPDKTLLIGFRNPIPGGKALLVPLLNPLEIIYGKTARFGEPILLNLDGLGVRDMSCWDGTYVILAGAAGPKGVFHLYLWPGGTAEPAKCKTGRFKGLTPEAVVVYPDKGLREIQILCDDGTRIINGLTNKARPLAERTFRSVWVKP